MSIVFGTCCLALAVRFPEYRQETCSFGLFLLLSALPHLALAGFKGLDYPIPRWRESGKVRLYLAASLTVCGTLAIGWGERLLAYLD